MIWDANSYSCTLNRTSLFLCLLMALSSLATPGLAQGQKRALLIGVSNYSEEKMGFDASLEGPANDIILMSRTLRRFGFDEENIIILSDVSNMPSREQATNRLPTRQNILDSLASLADAAQRDDEVIIYLSGHGSQQPEQFPEKKAKPESDGLDEVFLPIDTGRWSDEKATIENAILDDEFGEAIRQISNKGASLWFVADACHSGDITRGNFGSSARFVDGTDLGIPADRLLPKQNASTSLRGAVSNQPIFESIETSRNVVGFFAAAPGQLAVERKFPKSLSSKDRRVHGMLTYYLTRSLNQRREKTYRSLAEDIISGFSEWGTAVPTPQFEGELNRSIFPGGGWRLSSTSEPLQMEAGLLDGLGAGAIMKLSRTGDSDGIGSFYAQIQQISGTRSTLAAIDYRRTSAPVLPLPGDDWEGVLVQPAKSSVVSFSKPRQSPRPTEVEAQALSIIEKLQDTFAQSPGSRIEIAAPGSDASQLLFLQDNKLWFLEPFQQTNQLSQIEAINIDLQLHKNEASLSQAILETMERISHARNLLQAASKLSLMMDQEILEIQLFLKRHETAATTLADEKESSNQCAPVSTRSIPSDAALVSFESLEPGQQLALFHCDIVYLEIRNANPDIYIDLTPLYIDANAEISYVGNPNRIRLAPNSVPFILPLTILAIDQSNGERVSTGLEKLLLLAVEKTNMTAPMTDLRYLTDPSPKNLRGGEENSMTKIFTDVSVPGNEIAPRKSGPSPAESAHAMIYTWSVSEKREQNARQKP